MAYTDTHQGKLWANEEKTSPGAPDFKGQVCTTEDIKAVTSTGPDGKKSIDWSRIPSERKLSVSLWKNQEKDGNVTLNLKVAKKTDDLFPGKDDKVPF
tara:strand:+ start:470 stop:763 length:294 start_codon:yes stop_codon:yes gene_type:complete